MDIKFGRRINCVPLLVSLGISIFIGYIFYMATRQASIGWFFGVICLITVVLLYSVNLNSTYGFWRVTDNRIEYSRLSKRIEAILLPFGKKQNFIKFEEIESISLVVGDGIEVPKNLGIAPFGPYAPQAILSAFPTPYYVALSLKSGQEIDLDLYKNMEDRNDIFEMFQFISSRTGKKIGLVRI